MVFLYYNDLKQIISERFLNKIYFIYKVYISNISKSTELTTLFVLTDDYQENEELSYQFFIDSIAFLKSSISSNIHASFSSGISLRQCVIL